MAKPQTWLRRLAAPFIRAGSRFARNDRASTAIEFGLLAMPFFSVIFAIIETSMVFMAGQILDSAVQDSSRLIRTGRAQTASYTAAQYRQAVCNGLYNMFDCTKLKIRVTTVTSFATATVGNPINSACSPTSTAAQCDWTIVENYQPGLGSSIVLVQVYYKWPTIVNLPYFNLATQKGGTRLLSSIRVFRNEPF